MVTPNDSSGRFCNNLTRQGKPQLDYHALWVRCMSAERLPVNWRRGLIRLWLLGTVISILYTVLFEPFSSRPGKGVYLLGYRYHV